MNAISATPSAVVANASAAQPGTVQGAAAVAVLRRSMDLQAAAAAQLLAALPPQAVLATSGQLGTRL
ncbi:MAG TPA: putative motility protein, partial [Roseateles sp.]|nr:putative motility protein [Roseateles sp.]